jgi:hypothetical protein
MKRKTDFIGTIRLPPLARRAYRKAVAAYGDGASTVVLLCHSLERSFSNKAGFN